MANSTTKDAISSLLANPSPESSSQVPKIVFNIMSGNIQNMGLIRILDYAVNDIPKNEKFLIVIKCALVSPALEAELKAEGKSEESGIILKAKQGMNLKSAVKSVEIGIILKPNMAPSARMAMTRRVHPLVSLNPYCGSRINRGTKSVTGKGNMWTYKNARGEGYEFNVELTDEDGTQIQATMFNEAAKKFYDKFQLGKVYYISKGTLKVANKQFKTVQNDYEMTLNENSVVEEASDEATFIPETKFNFVPIDQLGPYVNSKELVGHSKTIPKRDITIADETKKTVVVSLWNDLATNIGQELLDISDKSPIVTIKSLKVGNFQGVSLSALSKSIVMVNPDTAESRKLRSWYDCEGKVTSMASIGSGISPATNNGMRSMYSDRVSLSDITHNPSLGEKKPVFFSIKVCISLIKPDQTMWYRACKTCNKKVTEAIGSGYWCEGCQKNDEECSLRYIMVVKVSDASGEAWLSVFNEQAEIIVWGEKHSFQLKLKEVTWVPHIFRVFAGGDIKDESISIVCLGLLY
ncbi:Replication protein A 70 kDa DNA-binding subunit B [Camellia lanceoleosa]|uniref:Replication protein A 70 kDa DNA-binding subunit B n=1 Tax=Camellia lanceoleosa TaxID=1840588 RepID=A0ACC0I035_9ERIC|nr:Replication protein A 70 kDa DNA-binding subunit B [Camellia lanceoleosa]